MSTLLEVKGLSVTLPLADGELTAVTDISINVNRGETLGIVGESGSGKSLSSMAIMGLLPRTAIRHASTLRFDNCDLLGASNRDMAKLRGNRIAMIFQEPMTSLNPVYTIGHQMREVMMLHKGVSKKEAEERAIYLLGKVGITAAKNRLCQYPHQLSGGLRQRVMIAMMLMCEPELIIADEPTTALDVTIQAQILHLLRELQSELNMAMIIITHDLGVVSRIADRVAVMYAGQIVEEGRVADVFKHPAHPYTQGLIESIPVPGQIEPGGLLETIPGIVPSLVKKLDGCRFSNRCRWAEKRCYQSDIPLIPSMGGGSVRCVLPLAFTDQQTIDTKKSSSKLEYPHGSHINLVTAPVLTARNVECVFHIKSNIFAPAKPLRAVNDVSLDLFKGEVVAIVGESGCGKSTFAKMLLGLQRPTKGKITLGGEEITSLAPKDISRRIQPIFQDPYSSLNPRRTIGEIVRRPLSLHGVGRAGEQIEAVNAMMERVGLPVSLYHNYPNQLSGGQRQRVAIARALVLKPDIVICDEPTSALDVSVQAQILNLLLELRREFRLTYLMITHDMAVVEHMATRVIVMYLGRAVEIADTKTLFRNPRHPYTKALLNSVLTPQPGAGIPDVNMGTAYPNPINLPSGCAFHPRCTHASQRCKTEIPALSEHLNGHFNACHLDEY